MPVQTSETQSGQDTSQCVWARELRLGSALGKQLPHELGPGQGHHCSVPHKKRRLEHRQPEGGTEVEGVSERRSHQLSSAWLLLTLLS